MCQFGQELWPPINVKKKIIWFQPNNLSVYDWISLKLMLHVPYDEKQMKREVTCQF